MVLAVNGASETETGDLSETQAITADKLSVLFMFTRTSVPISAFVV